MSAPGTPSDSAGESSLRPWADAVLAQVIDPSATVVVAAPGDESGYWAGGPSALWSDGAYYLAYRLRRPVDRGRGYANLVARSVDGTRFDTCATLTASQFECASLERPALARRPDGGWRVYVCCSTPQSKHWWIEMIEADTLEDLPAGRREVVVPGDRDTAFKDPVVRVDELGWHMWACRHPLDGGDDEADRMSSVYLTSDDGFAWRERSVALGPTPGRWDARGARVTSVLRLDAGWLATYDGRASAEENWFERTAIAVGAGPGAFSALTDPTPVGQTIRYVTIAEAPDEYRLYWESSRPDAGANDVRTAKLPRSVASRQE